jgi:hypothetical protein
VPGDRISIWVDQAAVGSGERPFVILSVEAFRVRLYSASAMTEVSVGRREFDQHAKSYGSLAESVLVILKRNVASGINPAIDMDLAQAVIRLVLDRLQPADVEFAEAA